ncbi:DUF2264 domain-containing protein [Algisphaera agarilytica]|uniref:DUF2264 domain-containing protein n=1 Tax=Algisphaera agarilytica TaxID=1385975 RepID=A0A7X0H6C8_9BACT|nr:DUF2264 domain-containing protein [Algisphaera agarilytica]MBB6430136.1 hypothetical protein [Algisphaera agarilytica]
MPETENHPAWTDPAATGLQQREAWIDLVDRIATPVFEHAAAGRIPDAMPMPPVADRRRYTGLEVFSRTLAGLAPWLEAQPEDVPEREAAIRQRLIDQLYDGLDRGTRTPDQGGWNYNVGDQPLVDAAHLAHAMLRAPKLLIDGLPDEVRQQLRDRLLETRVIQPPLMNWLLFAAIIEIALIRLGEAPDPMRTRQAMEFFDHFYLGDGWYADGFHHTWDYYNSFVIQPMLVDVLENLAPPLPTWDDFRVKAQQRIVRAAEVVERMISPEGTFPPLGRSICYRFGVLHLPGMVALRHELPDTITPAQLRCASTAVIGRFASRPGLFTDDGWLTIGFIGPQPDLPEPYLTHGSMYLCTMGLLPLGLPPQDPFWADPPKPWTSRAMWDGLPAPRDEARYDL